MATSPYFSTTNQYILYDIHVDEISVDEINNTSTVYVWVIAWRTNTGYQTYGTGTCYCNINGTSYSQEISSGQIISYESDTLLFEKTVVIPHNSDGSKRIYVSASIDHARFSSANNGFYVDLTQINTAPTAPTSFVITAGHGNYVGLGDEITLTWSGATGNITGYNIQWNRGNSGWRGWYDNYPTNKATFTMKDSFTDPSVALNGSGNLVKYRVKTLNGAYSSGWKESNALIISGGMNIKVNDSWKQGSAWIKVNGVWKRAKRIWVKQNNSWVTLD